jgi:large subunit ribosomal protein L10
VYPFSVHLAVTANGLLLGQATGPSLLCKAAADLGQAAGKEATPGRSVKETNVDRAQKAELVGSLHRTFEDVSIVVVAHNNGLTVGEITDLRRKMRANGASFRVTKNRLTRLALSGTSFEGLSDLFTGPTTIAYSKDPVAAAKVIVDYAKGNEKLVILGGAMGVNKLTVDGVKALATLPSLDALRGSILGMIQTPATRIAGILQAPGGQIARVLKAKAEKDAA